MSFSLEVRTDVRQADLAVVWGSALSTRGIEVEFPPNFSSEFKEGVLVLKVLSAPANLTRETVKGPVSAYFEFWEDEDGYGFSTASGRTVVDFVVQCLCAAALAEHLDALYIDPQMNESAKGSDAFRLAMAEIDYFNSLPGEAVCRKFIDWQEF